MFELQDALGELEIASEDLNQHSDSVADLIRQIEAEMNAANPGVEVWLRRAISEGGSCLNDERLTPLHNMIGYGRRNGKWRILIVETVKNDATKDAEAWRYAMPLLDAPRSDQLDSAPHLAELVQLVARRAQNFCDALRMAKLIAAQ